MNKKIIVLFLGLICTGLTAQVGIGTTTPNASSILDVSASDKGILVPRVSLPDVTDTDLDGVNTAATGLLIWNTNASVTGGSGVGYYYFNGTTWERLVTAAAIMEDADWHEVGTSNAPDDIGDDKFTLGNIGIGTTTAPYKLQITQTDNTATRTLSMNSTNATSGSSFSLYNQSTYTGSGDLRNYYSLVAGSATGNITSMYNNIQNGGDGIHTGVRNLLAGGGTGTHYGLFNSMNGSGSGQQNGVYNLFQNGGGSTHTGLLNSFNGTGTTQQGVYNDFSGAVAIINFGLRNNFASDNIAGTTDYGVFNEIGGNSDSPMYGVYNDIDNSGVGIHYGLYNTFRNGTGAIYGVYSEILTNNSGSTQYGSFTSLSGTGTNTAWIGSNNTFSGTVLRAKGMVNDFSAVEALEIRGVENILTYSGLAQGTSIFALFNEFNNTSVGDQYGLYQTFEGGGGNVYGIYNSMSSGISPFTGITNVITSTGPGDKYGSNTFIDSAAGGTHYGVYSAVAKVGSYAGYFDGDVMVTGTFTNPSDRSLKENITESPAVLDRLSQVQVKEYTFKKSEVDAYGLPDTKQTGFIAQELASVFPELVKDDHLIANGDGSLDQRLKKNVKTVNYIGMVPILTKAIQEQQDLIREQKNEIAELRREIEGIKAMLQQK